MTKDKGGNRRKGPGAEQVIALTAFLCACLLLIGVRIMIRQEWEMNALNATGVGGIADMLAAWNAQRTPEPTSEPTPEPTEEPMEEATQTPLFEDELPMISYGSELENVYPEVVDGFLPVCYGKVTNEKVVALTIDDCNQADNLRQIVRTIYEAGGKATIFPIGYNVTAVAGILQDAVNMGFEIENHTWSHSGLYDVDDNVLAEEIYEQNAEVSRTLGVDYQMHFLRPRGGDNRYDQRTHAYMRQMGYYGIAYWAQVGTDSTATEIMRDLQPGNIILFHTTDEDLGTIRDLVPMLLAAGYDLVTLNELYGIPDNEQNVLGNYDVVMPLEPYARVDQMLHQGDYLSDVLKMQVRLDELGYLNADDYNGYFGKKTKAALVDFQRDEGLDADGVCGPASWDALFPE